MGDGRPVGSRFVDVVTEAVALPAPQSTDGGVVNTI